METSSLPLYNAGIIFRVPLPIYAYLQKPFERVFFPVLCLCIYFRLNIGCISIAKFSYMQKKSS